MGNRLFFRLASASALTAALLVSALPAGQLPKRTGPCGQSLCNCPAVLFKTISTAHKQCNHHAKPACVITLHNAVDGAEGVSLQTVVSGLELPVASVIHAPQAEQKLSFGECLSQPSKVAEEIPTPPPRG